VSAVAFGAAIRGVGGRDGRFEAVHVLPAQTIAPPANSR
jgi:hypothetical protein